MPVSHITLVMQLFEARWLTRSWVPVSSPDSLSGAAGRSSQVPPDGGQAAPSDAEMLTSQLEALTLRSRGPRTTEDGH